MPIGSTLLENIITNHPDIDSMGELSFISDLVTKTRKIIFFGLKLLMNLLKKTY